MLGSQLCEMQGGPVCEYDGRSKRSTRPRVKPTEHGADIVPTSIEPFQRTSTLIKNSGIRIRGKADCGPNRARKDLERIVGRTVNRSHARVRLLFWITVKPIQNIAAAPKLTVDPFARIGVVGLDRRTERQWFNTDLLSQFCDRTGPSQVTVTYERFNPRYKWTDQPQSIFPNELMIAN